MHRLELTLPTPAANLALDEALLDGAEEGNAEWECLRLWESPQPVVVVGRSSRVHEEVNVAACRARGIPILRRSSGGAAIVAGPGCLMYSVVLSCTLRPELKDIRAAHAFVLCRLANAVQSLMSESESIRCAGTSDLVYVAERSDPAGRKFSGNSMRVKRTHLLYHGTLLYAFDLGLLEMYLRIPPRTPPYREGRPHRAFVANLPVARKALVAAVDRAWPTTGAAADWPRERTGNLVAERFSQASWNEEFR